MALQVLLALSLQTKRGRWGTWYDKSQHQHEHDSVVIVLSRSCKQKTPSGGPRLLSQGFLPSSQPQCTEHHDTRCEVLPQCITAGHMAQSPV